MCLPPVCLMDDIDTTAAGVSNYALLVHFDQEELENYKIDLVDARLGEGFSHKSKLYVMKYKEAINELYGTTWSKKSRKNTIKDEM